MEIASMSNQRAYSYVPCITCWKYDVFLSFRGEDTRKNFTDHLYVALNQIGLNVFRDDKELERGKTISSEVFKAIEESRTSIIVLSKNYASSTWCLEELSKIVQCMSTMGQMVIPIFYGVEPCVVRNQTENIKEAFDKHEEAFKENMEKVQKWRIALTDVANLSGWHLNNRYESEFIRDIAKEISSKLSHRKCVTPKELVGINSRMEKLRLLIQKGPNDVRMIGIYGMGGIGKTTIARAIYDLIYFQFEGSCFLANVREISEEGGFIPLQKQLLSQILMDTNIDIWDVDSGVSEIIIRLQHKKVLIVIDDVDNINQLNKLVGKHDWFSSGSRIIITTRDKHLLMTHGVDEAYKVEELYDDDALQLFSLKAFRSYKPSKDYLKLSECVVKYASGLPLALEVLGSFLFGKTIIEWTSALERLNRDSEKEILDILQISFDGLKETEKKIFLDIACFFKGKQIDYVTRILDSCDFYPTIGIRVLIDKSLIVILKDNELWMHDLLQEMGQQIVKRESIEEPGKRSRLWEEAAFCHMLTRNTGTEVVEAIILEKDVHFSANSTAFSKMINLRLLKIHNLQLPEGLDYLSNELRLLEWHGYPLKSLPSSLRLDKVVELKMQQSWIKQLWSGIKPLNNLRFMRLDHSQYLNKTPDFAGAPNLEELILVKCMRLREIHPSLLTHKKLVVLNLKGCISLRTLPSKVYMESLKELVLSGCSKLKKFPEIMGKMECLRELFLDGTGIKGLPLSIEFLAGLVLLDLKDCKNLQGLPNNIKGLKSLKTLNLSGCPRFENLPETLARVETLEELDVSGTAIRQPVLSICLMKNLKSLSCRGWKRPLQSGYMQFLFRFMSRRIPDPMALVLPSLSGLHSLTKLDLSDCKLMEGAIPCDFGSLLSLKVLDLSKNNFFSLPASINRLSKLEDLNLEGCKRLQSLPELPSNINLVRVDCCDKLEILSNALRLCTSKWLVISCVNCLKLLSDDNMAFSLFEEYLKAVSNPRTKFSIIVPGSKIPEWFSYQSEGSSVRVGRPPNFYNNKKLVGFAICFVFVVHEHSLPLNGKFSSHSLHCGFSADGRFLPYHPFVCFEEKFGLVVSSHLWLLYLSLDEYFDSQWQDEYNHIEFWFGSLWDLEAKKCGVYPIYEREGERVQ